MQYKQLVAGMIAATLSLFSSAATTASPDTVVGNQTMQDRVIETLRNNPGGVQTAWNEISWENGDIVLTLSSELGHLSPLAIPNCPAGQFCAFSGSNYSGSKVAFSTCLSNHSVATLGAPVLSIANNRSSGNVKGLNNSTVVITVPFNTGANTSGTITSLSCS